MHQLPLSARKNNKTCSIVERALPMLPATTQYMGKPVGWSGDGPVCAAELSGEAVIVTLVIKIREIACVCALAFPCLSEQNRTEIQATQKCPLSLTDIPR